jgi:hypothetical protein
VSWVAIVQHKGLKVKGKAKARTKEQAIEGAKLNLLLSYPDLKEQPVDIYTVKVSA